jgi:hypothetical protein
MKSIAELIEEFDRRTDELNIAADNKALTGIPILRNVADQMYAKAEVYYEAAQLLRDSING